ncbi:P-loop domain-containing protein [Tritonibacter mobilis]|uniref:ATP-binding protein n=1 Tax=Tritonibacter mobilis TaxID=379347 RepID=UPI0008069D9C|nr:ATP-binding protein [Tritonibacter mobilis]
MATDIKPTQLTRSGYEYQDLVCIGFIVEWYNDPKKYEWIRIEGDIEHEKLKGLDDVICKRPDGSFELTQVKFTIDPTRDDLALSFDWLLSKKKNGTSMLQKWAQDVQKFSTSGKLAFASVRTNRVPDQEFKSTLVGNLIDYKTLPQLVKEQFDLQLGGSQESKNFCANFNFAHSEQLISDFESRLHDRLVPDHTNEEGFHRLQRAIRQSATRLNFPSPDGTWKLIDIEEILRANLVQKLSQDFTIPDNYLPPSQSFHTDLISKSSAPGCHVIAGQPGMGKSTYLSYLSEELIGGGATVIRHHYWLGSSSVIDRIRSEHAIKSMMFQLQEAFPEHVQKSHIEEMKFDECVRAVSKTLKKNGKILVVIVDGLDHVHRDRPDISQLTHLLNRLIPLKDEVCLFFGTQPIDESYLPSSLTSAAPKKFWIDLPPMDLASTRSWLVGLHNANSFVLNGRKQQVDLELNEISGTLVAKTKGYPLHLIYSVRDLLVKDRHLSAYRVGEILPCPSGDIREYYQNIWTGLSAGSKDILLLIACVQFPWPDKGNLSKCYTDALAFQEAFGAVHHLIEQRQSGIYPFHGSLSVFLQATEEFKGMLDILMARVKNWLDDGAPDYWQWGWKWLTEASLGDPTALFEGVTKDWALRSISSGYSIDHIDHIIAVSEDYALEQGLYSELVRLRGVRIRVLNGPEQQIQDQALFQKCALSLQKDEYPNQLKLDNLRFLSDEEIKILPSFSRTLDDDICTMCFSEVLRRLELAVKFQDEHRRDRVSDLIYIAVDVLSHMAVPDYELLSDFFGRVKNKEKFILRYLEKLLENANAEAVVEVATYDFVAAYSDKTKELVSWACLVAEIDVEGRTDLPQLLTSYTTQAYSALVGSNNTSSSDPSAESEMSELSYREHFLNELSQALRKNSKPVDLVDIPRDDEQKFKAAIKTALTLLAQIVAQEVNDSGQFSTVSLFRFWDAVDIPSWQEADHSVSPHLTSVFRAVNEISVDLCFLAYRAQKAEKISVEMINDLFETSSFSSQLWLEFVLSKSCQEFIPKNVSEHHFKLLYTEVRERTDNIGTLANEALELCDLACRFQGDCQATALLELTSLHMLGHGWRKDISFHNLYQAVEHCAEANIGDVPDWLRRLSAPTNGVFDFTEKEIRHLPNWYFSLTGQCSFDRLPAELDYHLELQNWRNVDFILAAFVKFTSATSDTDKALLRCLVSRKPLLALEKRAMSSDELKRIYDEQIDFLGGLYSDNERSSSESNLSPQETSLVFSDFPPAKIRAFENSLKDENNFSYDEIVSDWIKYWSDAGEGLQVISAMEEIADDFTDRGWGLERNIGEIFELSHKLQGKNTAYKWALRDVKFNQLWSAYGGRDSTAKLRKYARIYKKKWQDFLQSTLVHEGKSTRLNLWNLAPTDNLVAFLIEAEQFDEAVAVIEAMLLDFEAGVRHLNLPEEYLPANIEENIDVSGRMLLSFYFIPDKVARLRVAKEISNLLSCHSDFRDLYLEKLGTLVYEADICDFLSILNLDSSVPFAEAELRSAIKHPSVLSEYIFSSLGFDHYFSDVMYSDFPKAELKHSEKMARSKNGIPSIWDVRLQRLSQVCGLRLDLHLAAEWEELVKRKKFYFFNHSDFISEKYHSLNETSCSLSWNCETAFISAYLRTIAYCYSVGCLDYTDLTEYITPALPFGKPLSNVAPAERPNFWPDFNDFWSSEKALSSASLQHWLDNWSPLDEVPLFASGPVPTGESGLDADFDCIVVAEEGDLDQKKLEAFFGDERIDESSALVEKVYHWGLGRWQAELYMRGFAAPSFKIDGHAHTSKSFDNKIAFVFDHDPIAHWKFWHEEWFPARLRGCGSNIAVATSCVPDHLEKIADALGCDLHLAVRLKVMGARFTFSKVPQGEYFATRKIYTKKTK